MKLTWFGTATIGIENNRDSIIFDPFFPMNNSLPHPDPERLAVYSNIFVTHSHFDHLLDVPRLLSAGANRVYCSAEATKVLISKGIGNELIQTIKPGDHIEIGSLKIDVFKGAHIKFDLPLIIKTLFSSRTIRHFRNFTKILRLAKVYPEGQVLIYKITAGGNDILHLGSLNLDPYEKYPNEPSLLTIPFQGRNDLNRYTPQFIEKLKPKRVFLHHFDDTFPPISSCVNTRIFVNRLAAEHPELDVIVPRFNEPIIV